MFVTLRHCRHLTLDSLPRVARHAVESHDSHDTQSRAIARHGMQIYLTLCHGRHGTVLP